jgi:tetratricopeptide (TPR) repeat protein
LVFCGSRLSLAQQTRAQLEVSETFFTLISALNSCGYDAGLQDSVALRQAIRLELQAVMQQSPEAARSRNAICQFWGEHQPAGTQHDVSQYISLALELNNPPGFATRLPEADLPPDAAHVFGVISLLQKFYQAAGIHALWQKHRNDYETLVQQYHDPIAAIITRTDLYLRLPFANYPGQRYAVYLEPMLAPSQVDARNYGNNYYLVLSPSKDGNIRSDEIRHTYLHFVLDPLAAAHGTSLKRMEPILLELHNAPMARSFKDDVALLVNECLIRAIETRLAAKADERTREALVQRSVQQGFVLTRYFYDALNNFEKESASLRTIYGDLLYNLDVSRERKRARDVVFARQADPELISPARIVGPVDLLNQAEEKMAEGDVQSARNLAEQVLQHNRGGEEPGRAAFLVARIATLQGKMEEARLDFERTLKVAQDPRTLAWSHIYLGRILDIQKQRDAAVEHYRAALEAGDPAADTRRAAENGIAMPFHPPKAQ